MRKRVSSFDFVTSVFFEKMVVDQERIFVQFLSPFLTEIGTTILGLETDLGVKFVVTKVTCHHEHDIRHGAPCRVVRTLNLGERSIFLGYKITPKRSDVPVIDHEVVVVLMNEKGRRVKIPDKLRNILTP